MEAGHTGGVETPPFSRLGEECKLRVLRPAVVRFGRQYTGHTS
jgi:hypothetical protein